MAESTQHHFNVEDTVALLSDPERVGMIDRNFFDVSSHRPNPAEIYLQDIEKSKLVTDEAFAGLLQSGVPPRGTVLVSFASLPQQGSIQAILLQESEIKLVDRSLLFGDLVKRSPGEAMSGIVIENVTKVSLIQPSKWPSKNPVADLQTRSGKFGCFDMDQSHILHDVPSYELKSSVAIQEGGTLLCRYRVGRIKEAFEEWAIRLENNSVVVIKEEEADETMMEYLKEEESAFVGLFIRCKKGTLRRGKWIWGDFDPNVDPAGFICDINVTSVLVNWRMPIVMGYEDGPPEELDAAELDHGGYRVYDRSETLARQGSKKLSLELCVGNIVRFRDLAGAALKYDGTHNASSNQEEPNKLNRIPRSETLGYDLNVFHVVAIKTECTVQWQDATVTKHFATDLHPTIELEDDDAVWPGELVATREHSLDNEGLAVPQKVGIVQSVNAVDRIAQVQWMESHGVKFITEEWNLFHRDTVTGVVDGPTEEMSLYDIVVPPSFSRRLGDFVVIAPTNRRATEDLQDSEIFDWFGEIIELGLDGLLTVRVGASTKEPRDIRVPWEWTELAHSADEDEDQQSLASTESEVDSLMDGSGESEEVEWRDMDDEVVDEADTEWTTDEESLIDGVNDKTDEDAIDVDDMEDVVDSNTTMEGKPAADSSDINLQDHMPLRASETFSYSSMFCEQNEPSELDGTTSTSSNSKPTSFLVLEGQAPNDFYFPKSSSVPTQLRRIQKEHKILRTSLPDGVYVRTWESSLDRMRILILGPMDTPYEYAPFVIDLLLDQDFPTEPPRLSFHSWTDFAGPINPNLYEDGTICLSLLGTWPGDTKQESWSPTKSTILQIIVSLLGLVLVKEPYYNEAGYESRAGTAEAELPSALYSERVYFRSRNFINRALNKKVPGFEDVLAALYLRQDAGCPQLLVRAILSALAVARRSSKAALDRSNGKENKISTAAADEQDRTISPGALISLRRQIGSMIDVLEPSDATSATELRRLLDDFSATPDKKTLQDSPAAAIFDRFIS